MKQVTAEHLFAIAEMAKGWPTVNEAATRSGVSVPTLNRALRNGHVLSFKTNVTRVEPVSFAAWLAGRQRT